MFYINTKEQATLKVLKLSIIEINPTCSISHSKHWYDQKTWLLKLISLYVLHQKYLVEIKHKWNKKNSFFGKDFSPIWSGDGFVLRQEFLLKKNLNQKQQKKPANSAASSQKPLRYQGRRNVKNFGGTSQLVGHNLLTPWLE